MPNHPIPTTLRGQPWSEILWADVLQYTDLIDQHTSLPHHGQIVDIGGNIGCAAILFHLHYQARVYSVEAIAETHASLQKNCSSYPEITPIHTAVGEKNGVMQLYRYPLAPGLGGLDSSRIHIVGVLGQQAVQNLKWSTFKDILLFPLRLLGFLLWMCFSMLIVAFRYKQEVPLQTLSTMIATNIPEGTIDLLKIDIEGHELSALRGLQKEDWDRIQNVIMEVHPQHHAEVIELLEHHQLVIQSVEQGVISVGNAPKIVLATRA